MSLLNRVNGSDPRQDPTSIGNLAVSKGYSTLSQVVEALDKQEERLPLGELLVEAGALTHAQLEELLLEQEIIRKRLSPKKAAKLTQQRRREKMREVSAGLKDVASSLTLLAKS